METDREVLLWFHERLVHVHKESELFDYMHRLRAIIAKTPPKKYTPCACFNSIADVYKAIKFKTPMEKVWAKKQGAR